MEQQLEPSVVRGKEKGRAINQDVDVVDSLGNDQTTRLWHEQETARTTSGSAIVGQPCVKRPTLHQQATDTILSPPSTSRAIPEDIAVRQADVRRPSLLQRATDTVLFSLSMSPIFSDGLSPASPSNWLSYRHAIALLKIWDTAYARTTKADQLKCSDRRTNDILVYLQGKLVRDMPELGQGKRVLTVEWIVHILASNRRSPFYQVDGKRERLNALANSRSAMSGWGPW